MMRTMRSCERNLEAALLDLGDLNLLTVGCRIRQTTLFAHEYRISFAKSEPLRSGLMINSSPRKNEHHNHLVGFAGFYPFADQPRGV